MKNSFENKSTQQLENNYKLLKVIVIMLSVVLFLFLAVAIYGMFTKGFNASYMSVFPIVALIPIQIMNMRRIKEELDRREANS